MALEIVSTGDKAFDVNTETPFGGRLVLRDWDITNAGAGVTSDIVRLPWACIVQFGIFTTTTIADTPDLRIKLYHDEMSNGAASAFTYSISSVPDPSSSFMSGANRIDLDSVAVKDAGDGQLGHILLNQATLDQDARLLLGGLHLQASVSGAASAGRMTIVFDILDLTKFPGMAV